MKEAEKRIMLRFDKIFDEYNDKKMTKEVMLEACKKLYAKLSIYSPKSKV